MRQKLSFFILVSILLQLTITQAALEEDKDYKEEIKKAMEVRKEKHRQAREGANNEMPPKPLSSKSGQSPDLLPPHNKKNKKKEKGENRKIMSLKDLDKRKIEDPAKVNQEKSELLAKIKELEKQLEETETQVKETTKLVVKAEFENLGQKLEITNLKRLLSQEEQNLGVIRLTLKLAETEKTNASNRAEAAETKLIEANNEINSLQMKVVALEQQLNSTIKRKDDLLEENEQLKKQLGQNQSLTQSLQEDLGLQEHASGNEQPSLSPSRDKINTEEVKGSNGSPFFTNFLLVSSGGLIFGGFTYIGKIVRRRCPSLISYFRQPVLSQGEKREKEEEA